MTAVEEETPAPKKKAKKADESTLHVAEPSNVVELPKSKPKPGAEDYDWQAEYPGEDVYVYTVPNGTDSPAGLTIGLTKLGPKRKPRPGELHMQHQEGGMSVMWYFLRLSSSPASLQVQRQLEEPEYTAMLRGWAEFAGIELSE